jgi:predicted ArsR family transcriptional regulator
MSSKNANFIKEFAENRAEDLEKKIEKKLARTKDAKDRVKALADFLTTEGYSSTIHKVGLGHEMCQHHCPIAHVAAEFPDLCEAETAVFSKTLGTHVQRLATIAHGDGVCTTYIPLVKGK